MPSRECFIEITCQVDPSLEEFERIELSCYYSTRKVEPLLAGAIPTLPRLASSSIHLLSVLYPVLYYIKSSVSFSYHLISLHGTSPEEELHALHWNVVSDFLKECLLLTACKSYAFLLSPSTSPSKHSLPFEISTFKCEAFLSEPRALRRFYLRIYLSSHLHLGALLVVYITCNIPKLAWRGINL